MNNQARVGETTSVSIQRFTAQTYDLYQAPRFGDFVRIASTQPGVDIIAVVSEIRTAPIDPSRPVIARGEELADEQAIYEENPHFEHVMRTQFDAVVVGFLQAGQPLHILPPQPPRVHGFVYLCSLEEIAAFAHTTGFIRLLLAAGAGNDLLTACLAQAAAATQPTANYLVGAGQDLLRLLAEQPDRLAVLLPLLSQIQAGPPPPRTRESTNDWGQHVDDEATHVHPGQN